MFKINDLVYTDADFCGEKRRFFGIVVEEERECIFFYKNRKARQIKILWINKERQGYVGWIDENHYRSLRRVNK